MSCIESLLQLPETSESELSKLRPLPSPLALPDATGISEASHPPMSSCCPLQAHSRLFLGHTLLSASGLLHRPFPQSIRLSLTLKDKFSFSLPEPFQCPQGHPPPRRRHTHTYAHVPLSFPSTTSSTMVKSPPPHTHTYAHIPLSFPLSNFFYNGQLWFRCGFSVSPWDCVQGAQFLW